MKLKTLKDLEGTIIEVPIVDSYLATFLKQEAIKWIKELKHQWSYEPYARIGQLVIPCRKEIIEWIKYFFGITEEDLKNNAGNK